MGTITGNRWCNWWKREGTINVIDGRITNNNFDRIKDGTLDGSNYSKEEGVLDGSRDSNLEGITEGFSEGWNDRNINRINKGKVVWKVHSDSFGSRNGEEKGRIDSNNVRMMKKMFELMIKKTLEFMIG